MERKLSRHFSREEGFKLMQGDKGICNYETIFKEEGIIGVYRVRILDLSPGAALCELALPGFYSPGKPHASMAAVEDGECECDIYGTKCLPDRHKTIGHTAIFFTQTSFLRRLNGHLVLFGLFAALKANCRPTDLICTCVKGAWINFIITMDP